MIISASRRTDIPAAYAEWFIWRVRSGFCEVPNPSRSSQVTHVSLDPAKVDAIVFWSKEPSPLLPHLGELDSRGYRYYFQFTLNAYDAELEPGMPPVEERVRTFQNLSDQLGPDRLVWRYDPIIISAKYTPEWHAERFTELAKQLQGYTNRVVISVVDNYKHVESRLIYTLTRPPTYDMTPLMETIVKAARASNIRVQSCAEDLRKYGIEPGRCVDPEVIELITGRTVTQAKDQRQRKACGCVPSQDIGVHNTCPNGCVYCYSNTNHELAKQRWVKHDSDGWASLIRA